MFESMNIENNFPRISLDFQRSSQVATRGQSVQPSDALQLRPTKSGHDHPGPQRFLSFRESRWSR